MKHLFLLLILALGLSASTIKTTLLSIDYDKNRATVKLDKIDIGISGFLVHTLAQNHTSILKNVHVIAYDKDTKIATLEMDDFNALKNNALPTGKWKAVVGDKVELAFGYSRSMLIAPSEEIYHRITKSVQTQWVHIDIFATVISYRGHPTPLKEDFNAMSVASSVGLLFIYLDQKLYTVDIKTFVILSISDAPLVQDTLQLPFYSRVVHISSNWWGEGSSELKAYEPYYFGLLKEYNPRNKELLKNIEKFEKGQNND
ncbi:plasminogen-binding N-terminal domain-containing protein [Sulfurimonas sp. SAG-AH-194-L11]|nr:plasminogen-binding N-terminal domain-containing protein [Sulfurimonas sp. SAG-AH-194-L11]MDF1876596.1 plasminogen-binding N-terminal domain-containing protein [Sulfurimonas sp. SAG-AH-194-L11]